LYLKDFKESKYLNGYIPPFHLIVFEKSSIYSTYQFCPANEPQIIALFSEIYSLKYYKCPPAMLSLISYIIPRNLYKESLDAAITSFIMTATRCLYISHVHDSTLL
jgi:hypothetical protein